MNWRYSVWNSDFSNKLVSYFDLLRSSRNTIGVYEVAWGKLERASAVRINLNESVLCKRITMGKWKDVRKFTVFCLDLIADLNALDDFLSTALECYDGVPRKACTSGLASSGRLVTGTSDRSACTARAISRTRRYVGARTSRAVNSIWRWFGARTAGAIHGNRSRSGACVTRFYGSQ